MPRYGYTLLCEIHGPLELLDQARRSEAAGFDFIVCSDHFHPWLPEHGHSPFAWSLLGAVASQTTRAELATMVTCPFMRYHPAVIAQAAATIAIMSNGRFTLGLGAGERLNEHITGDGWPMAGVRHEMLRESAIAIRELWSGETTNYEGDYVSVADAKLYDVPDQRPGMYLAASGEESAELALEIGEGICTVTPMPDLISQFKDGGGDPAKVWCQTAFSWDADRERAVQRAWDRFRFGMPGWHVMAELPNVPSFAAASKLYRPEDVARQVPSGNDPRAIVDNINSWIDGGYENIAVLQVADDIDGFLRAWETDIRPKLP